MEGIEPTWLVGNWAPTSKEDLQKILVALNEFMSPGSFSPDLLHPWVLSIFIVVSTVPFKEQIYWNTGMITNDPHVQECEVNRIHKVCGGEWNFYFRQNYQMP